MIFVRRRTTGRRVVALLVGTGTCAALLSGAPAAAGAESAAWSGTAVGPAPGSGAVRAPLRHRSGLTLLPPARAAEVPARLASAWSAATETSRAAPWSYGPVSLAADGRSVRLGVVRGPAGGTAATATTASGEVAALPSTVRRVPVEHSLAFLDEVRHAAIDVGASTLPGADGIVSSHLDTQIGRVVLTVRRLSDPVADALVRRFGTDLVSVRVDPTAPVATANDNRQDDGSPFYGGARIVVPDGTCSDAFGWRIGGSLGMLTAGHCVHAGGRVRTTVETMGSVSSGTRENWRNGTGTVRMAGQTRYRGDVGWVVVISSKKVVGRVYRGTKTSTKSSRVSGMSSRRAKPGDRFCTSAIKSGEVCGWVVGDTDVDVRYTDPRTGAYTGTARNLVRSSFKKGQCTMAGDSGGAVIVPKTDGTVAARGIHSGGAGGGDDHIGGPLDRCQVYFTDIYDAKGAFGGSIVIG